jgi:hypothetical protein
MLFCQALFVLAAYDALKVVCPFRCLHHLVKNCRVSECAVTRAAREETVARVCIAVNHACIWYPKRALCLQRAFVTTWLLRKHGVQASMVLGAQKLPFKAHAWVEIEGKAVNERSNVQATYAVWERC